MMIYETHISTTTTVSPDSKFRKSQNGLKTKNKKERKKEKQNIYKEKA
jgi:hypothetical protein